MNELVLPPAYQELLRKACERAYKKGLKRGKRAGHANGHSAGREELLSGLKALAQLNGTATPLMRITKAFDESKHPRDEHGRFTTGAEIAAAAADPAKRAELEAGMDAENKQKLANAIDEHKGGDAKPTADSSTTHTEAAEGLKKLHAAYRAKGGVGAAASVSGPEQAKLYEEAVNEASDYVLKLNREELTKLKESLSLKVGGRKADIAKAVATKIMNAAGVVVGEPKQKLGPATGAEMDKTAAALGPTPEVTNVAGAIKEKYGETAAIVPSVATAAAKPPHEMGRSEYLLAARAAGKDWDTAGAEHTAAVKAAAKQGLLSDDVIQSLPYHLQTGVEHDNNAAKSGAMPGGKQGPPAPAPELAGNLPLPTQFGDEPHYVTGGNTYQHREQLSRIGGRWDTTRRRWVVPAAALSKLPAGLKGVPL